MMLKLVQFLDRVQNHNLFPIVALVFILSLLLLFITGPVDVFDLGLIGQRKADQASEASEEAEVQAWAGSEVYLVPLSQKQLSAAAQQARLDALENSIEFYPDQGALLALEDNFQISYVEEDDRFVISIWEAGYQNVEQARVAAEKYFLENIVKTQDKSAVCELDVDLAVYHGAVSRLSLCE